MTAALVALVVSLGATPGTRAAPTALTGQPVLEVEEYGPLEAAWSEVQSDLRRKAWAEAAGQLHHLTTIRDDLGLPNLFEMSAALLHAAESAGDDGAGDTAASLAAAAASLSPDLAAAKLEEANLAFELAPFSVGTQLKAIRSGFERLEHDLPGTLGWVGNTAGAYILVVMLLLLACALSQVLRYRAVWAGDIQRILPPGVTRSQAMVVLATLLVAPFLMGLGLILTCALWLVGTALYQRRTERAASILLLVAVGAIPIATNFKLRAMTYPSQPEALLYRCNKGLCDLSDRAELRDMAAGDALAYEATFTLGLVSRRAEGAGRGAYSEALRLGKKALEQRETAEAHVLLGSVEYGLALKECDGLATEQPAAVAAYDAHLHAAGEHFDRAAELAPDRVEPLYDGSVVARLLGQDGRSDELASRASKVAPERVEQFVRDVSKDMGKTRCKGVKTANRHLMEVTLPTAALRDKTLSREVPSEGLVVPLAGLFIGRTPPWSVAVAGFGGAGLVLLLSILSLALKTSRVCKVCGGIADPRTRLDLGSQSVCRACLLADIRRGIGDAKEQWARDQKIYAEAVKRLRVPRLLTWVLPGFGHLLRGAPLRGLLILTLVLGSVLVGLDVHAVVHDPRHPHGLGAGRMFLAGSIAGITYLLALIDAHTARPPRPR